jgi:hypothetical protein
MDKERLNAILNNGKTEYVQCSAILLKDYFNIVASAYDNAQTYMLPYNVGEDDLVLFGLRHPQILCTYAILTGEPMYKKFKINEGRIDGFLTSKNRFLTREEALELVLENGQLKGDIIGGMLTSEDLW